MAGRDLLNLGAAPAASTQQRPLAQTQAGRDLLGLVQQQRQQQQNQQSNTLRQQARDVLTQQGQARQDFVDSRVTPRQSVADQVQEGVDAVRSVAGGYLTQRPTQAAQPQPVQERGMLETGIRNVAEFFGTDLDIATQGNQPENFNTYQTRPDALQQAVGDEDAQRKGLARFDQLAQGLTLGFSDEAEAAFRSMVGDETYEQARESARARIDAGSDELGQAEALFYNVVGSLPTSALAALKVGQVAKAANLGTRATTAANIGTAAAEGALAGQGQSTADIGTGENLSDTLIGGALGAAFGAGGEAIGRGTNQLLDSAMLNRRAGQRSVARTLQEAAETTEGGEEAVIDSVARQLQQVQDAGVSPVLADAEELQDLVRGSNQLRQLSPELRDQIGRRQERIQTTLTERVDPTLSTTPEEPFERQATVLGGREVTDAEIIPRSGQSQTAQSGVVNLNAYADAARREGNQQAADLYQQAYAKAPTTEQYASARKLVESSPTLANAVQQGRRNAQDINLANGITDRPEFVQVMDEASKILGQQLRSSEAGQSRAAISGLKKQLDAQIEQVAPELSQARAASKQGQATKGFVEGGKTNVDSQSIDAVDDFVRTLDLDTPAAQQAALGAGRAVREAVFNRASAGTRDSATGRLLSQRQLDNYNRIADRSAEGRINKGVLSKLLDTEGLAARTKKVSEVNRRSWQEELRSALSSNLRDVAGAAGLVSFVAAPSPVTFAIASGRLGQAAASRLNQSKLAKQIQELVFSSTDALGSSVTLRQKRQYLESLLKGDFNKIPPEVLRNIGQSISNSLGVQAAGFSAEQG